MTQRTPFTRIESVALPMPEGDIDTDIIFPARFLLLTARKGLGRYAFHDRRFAEDGSALEDCIWHRPDKIGAAVIVAGGNFGCGSSREQAVWALDGAGIRAVIAPSFGEIFHSNCLRNGLLPIKLDNAACAVAMQAATRNSRFMIKLDDQSVVIDGRELARFDIAAEQKTALVNGWDETDQILEQYSALIGDFESRQSAIQPWLYDGKTTDQ